MYSEAFRDLIVAGVPEFSNRLELIADFQELIRRDQLPQAPLSGFVIPVGLTAISPGDAGANTFSQSIDDTYALVIILRASGDIGGGKSLPGLDTLTWKVIRKVVGNPVDMPDDGDDGPESSSGVWRFSRGRLIDIKAGAVFYQLDFAIQRFLEVSP